MMKTRITRILPALLLALMMAAGLGSPLTVQASSRAADDPFVVTPLSTSQSGAPNSSVQYQLTAFLSADAADPVAVSVDVLPGVFASASVNSESINLSPGESYVFRVVVNIPADSAAGSKDITQVVFNRAGGSPITIGLTTLAVVDTTEEPTNAPGAQRPLVVIDGYSLDEDTLRVGDSFKLFVHLKNNGKLAANNLILSFVNESFLPQETGGVVALGQLNPGKSRDISQSFLASSALSGQSIGIIPVKLTYNDENGATYTESFAVTLQLQVYSGGAALPTATPTPALVMRPQMVVGSYATDVDPLQPGSMFALSLKMRNLGNTPARSVTMVLGGGVLPDVSSGTPQPGGGGVSGGGSELTTFAPIGSSNLVFLGDVVAGAEASTKSNLIVNVSANPGAYTLRLSFVYNDDKGNRLVDDQIITLLVYRLPQVEVNFYREVGPIFAGQPAQLPFQVVNLARQNVVMGKMNITAPQGELQNQSAVVGPIDPGGSFTQDIMFTPAQAGELDLNVELNYVDDFNQPRQIVKPLHLSVIEAPAVEPGMNPGDMPVVEPTQETFFQKVLRFFKGLFGLDSAQATPQPGDMPVDKGESVPLPVEKNGGKAP